jgi:hypothetical protein
MGIVPADRVSRGAAKLRPPSHSLEGSLLELLAREFACDVEIIHGVTRHVVVVVGAATLDGVDFEEPSERGHILSRPHLDGGEGALVLEGTLVLAEPAVVEVAPRVIG